MNKKGIELAVSTLILIVIGIFVLIGLTYAVTKGFGKLQDEVDDKIGVAEYSKIVGDCNLACTNGDKNSFCCQERELAGEKVMCSNALFDLDCELDCSAVSCLND